MKAGKVTLKVPKLDGRRWSRQLSSATGIASRPHSAARWYETASLKADLPNVG